MIPRRSFSLQRETDAVLKREGKEEGGEGAPPCKRKSYFSKDQPVKGGGKEGKGGKGGCILGGRSLLAREEGRSRPRPANFLPATIIRHTVEEKSEGAAPASKNTGARRRGEVASL